MSPFPQQPGYTNEGTSKEAARAASLWSNGLRVRVLLSLATQPGTVHQLCERLKVDYRSLQPRVSELKAMGYIQSCGVAPSPLGPKPELVWRVVRANLPPEFTGLGQGHLFA